MTLIEIIRQAQADTLIDDDGHAGAKRRVREGPEENRTLVSEVRPK